jgi:hypothetical protein
VTRESEYIPPGVDASRPSSARVTDYNLGGTHNFAVDRTAAEGIRAVLPELSDIAWVNRGFLQRSVRFLIEQGIHQFLDLGAGLPTQTNTHDVAQKFAPGARVVYVDYDPGVAVQAAPLLSEDPNTTVVTADLTDPEAVLAHPEVRRLIDFDEPVGLIAVAVLHFVPDETDPWRIVAHYLRALVSGSYFVMSHGTSDRQSETLVDAARRAYCDGQRQEQRHQRSKPEVERFFAGLDIVPPYPGGAPQVSYIGEWGAEDPAAADSDGSRWFYAGVARKP